MSDIFEKKINKDLKLIKHNTLIESEYSLSPVPNNLMNLAVFKVRQTIQSQSDLDTVDEVVITADEYAKTHGIEIRTAYKDLKKAILELEAASIRCDAYYDFNRTKSLTMEQKALLALELNKYSNVVIGTKPKHGNYLKMKLHIKLVDRVGYSEEGSFVYLRFSDDVMHLIQNSELDYTSYPYSNTIEMNITPTKRMYELAYKWVKIGECKKTVDDWRHFFGLDTKYENIAELKRRVIDPAIKGVNKQGDFLLTLEQQKIGKTITHLTIKIKDKRKKSNSTTGSKRDQNTVDMFVSMTDKQRFSFASKLSRMPEMSSYSQGTEDYEQFAVRIAEMLQDSQKQKDLMPLLLKVGYSPKT